MPEPSTLLPFALASFALVVVPGPSVIYIVTRGLDQGRGAALVSMFGIQAGGLMHVVGAAIGVSALIASSATAFTIVKLAGAAYLIYLGIRKLREPDQVEERPAPAPRSRLFWQGFTVNVLNPKTAMFFLAFLPHFVDPARGAVAGQVLVLGACFLAVATVSDGAYALAASSLAARLRNSTRFRRRMSRASGSVYIALGAGAAVAER